MVNDDGDGDDDDDDDGDDDDDDDDDDGDDDDDADDDDDDEDEDDVFFSEDLYTRYRSPASSLPVPDNKYNCRNCKTSLHFTISQALVCQHRRLSDDVHKIGPQKNDCVDVAGPLMMFAKLDRRRMTASTHDCNPVRNALGNPRNLSRGGGIIFLSLRAFIAFSFSLAFIFCFQFLFIFAAITASLALFVVPPLRINSTILSFSMLVRVTMGMLGG